MPRVSRIVAGAAGLAIAFSLGAVSIPGAIAAAGDPFDPAQPVIFVGQGSPTQLSIAQADASGTYSFADEGGPAPLEYNALSYNTADDYLYAFTTTSAGAIPAGALVRIGQDNVVTRIGAATFPTANSGLNLGAYNPADGKLYAASYMSNTLYIVDPADGTSTTVTLSQTMHNTADISDWAFSGGYLWGLGDNNTIGRIDIATGQVDTFSSAGLGIDKAFAGAAWTYLDDALGFSHNGSGEIDRIEVTSPGAAAPAFTLLKKSTGPSSSRNDGAMAPGLPADLAVTKAAALAADGTVTYTIQVANNGAGWSTGSTLTDDVPAAVSGVAATSADAKCETAGRAVTCEIGQLKPGESAKITVTGTIATDDKVTNAASVAGNEPDPKPANNTASATVSRTTPTAPTSPTPTAPSNPTPKPRPSLMITKSATPTRVSRAGQVVRYRFKIRNTGNVIVRNVHAVEGTFSGTGHMSRPVCPKVTLKPGRSEVCTATYAVTVKDARRKKIMNTARAVGIDPGGKLVVSRTSSAKVRVVPPPAFPNTGA